MIGQTISHYKILEKIGAGGMGVVYKAKDLKLDRSVALKFLPQHMHSDEEEKKRFIHEAKAASALDHNHICTIHEIGETDDGQLFIVMAHYEGETLKEHVARGPIPIDEALDIARQVAEGLKKAHEQQIIHRDIKPANIIITEDGVVKIVDFGLAKLAGQTRLTQTGSTLGTVAYMSPEQTTGDDVDHRSDIWSLGVVFYEMLARQLPFRGHYEQAIVYSIINEEPEPLRKLNTDIPNPMEQILQKMLAKDPSKRYVDLADFLEDIQRFQRGKEPRDIASETIYQFISRPRFLIPAIFIFLVMIMAGYLVLKNGKKFETTSTGSTHLTSLAVVYFDNKSGDKNLDNWRDALPELLTTDLSQSKYLRVLRSDQIYGIYKKLNLLKAERYTEQDLKGIARNGGVDHIVKGSYIKVGAHLVITAMLIHADSGETISSLSLKAEGEKDIFSKIDQITREIKVKLNITPDQLASDIDKEVGTISTTSSEALSHYMKGRHHHYEGNFRESIRSMERALSYDPGFAMAYRSMTWSYYHLGLLSEQMQSLKKAMELSDNLPTLERYVIQGDYYRFNQPPGETLDRALESIQKALHLYPDNPLANGKLIELCAIVEDWNRAIDRFAFIKEKHMSSHFDYHYIGIFYCAKGSAEKAVENLHYYLENIQDSYVIRWTLALVYVISHKFDLALSEINQAIAQESQLEWLMATKAVIHLFREDFAEVERICNMFLDQEDIDSQLAGRKMNGLVYLLQGRLAEAEAQCREGKTTAEKLGIKWEQSRFASLLGYIHLISEKYQEALGEYNDELEIYEEFGWSERKIRARYLKAFTLLEQQSPEGSQKAEADLLERVKNALNKKFKRYTLNYLGRKELDRNHVSNAIVHFEQALSLLPHERPPWERIDDVPQVLFIEPLARAYLKSGDLEKAQEAYEKISNLTWGRLFYGDLYALSFYHLGGIYSQKGWKGKSIESYQKFINLWKNCDPIFQPLVEDARERVKKLEENQ